MKIKFPGVKIKSFPFSREKYWLFIIAAWLYTIIWMYSLVLMYHWEVSLWIKLPIYLVLICATPSFSDLIKSYEQYKKEWELEQEASKNIIRSGVGREGMISKTGIVIKKCDPEGRVKIGNETWRALTADKSEIDTGTTVIVRDITGMTLIIEKKTQEEAVLNQGDLTSADSNPTTGDIDKNTN